MGHKKLHSGVKTMLVGALLNIVGVPTVINSPPESNVGFIGVCLSIIGMLIIFFGFIEWGSDENKKS